MSIWSSFVIAQQHGLLREKEVESSAGDNSTNATHTNYKRRWFWLRCARGGSVVTTNVLTLSQKTCFQVLTNHSVAAHFSCVERALAWGLHFFILVKYSISVGFAVVSGRCQNICDAYTLSWILPSFQRNHLELLRAGQNSCACTPTGLLLKRFSLKFLSN